MLLEMGHRDIGFIAYLQLCPDTYYLLGLYLIDEVQRKGYGTRALDVLRSRLNILNRGDLYLLVHKEATWAINFYHRYGFKICGGNKLEATQELPMMKDLYINNTYLMSHKERRGQ